MKVTIIGSKSVTAAVTAERLIKQAIRESGFDVKSIVVGYESTVDKVAAAIAGQTGMHCDRLSNSWGWHGRKYGQEISRKMVNMSGGLIALWDGTSPRTGHIIQYAYKKDTLVYVLRVDNE